MLQEFLTFAQLGLRHIADLAAYDHILFVAALTAAYPPAEWRRLAVLVTAFTVGHSLTLALATLDVVRVHAALVEFLIPVTIVVTSVLAIASERRAPPSGEVSRGTHAGRYALAALFGLVHGLGFSSYLRAILGGEESIVGPLLAFNLGLEAGQLAIVAAVLLLGVAAERTLRLSRRDWVMVLSGATAGIALTMLFERLPS